MSTDTLKLYRQETLDLFEDNGLINHVELAEKFSSSLPGKNLAQKNSGKFYTPEVIASPLIKQVLDIINIKNKNGKIKIIDPFCGDGRLIAWTLPHLKNLDINLEIHLWDYDEEAVRCAETQIKETAQKYDLKFTIHSKKADAFSEFFSSHENSFDIVITNPPWEVVKPDPKDLMYISDEENKNLYVSSLKEFSNRLLRDFPRSKPTKSYGGWGVNLARVGTELAIRLAKKGGGVGIVAPSTIFADQNSYQLRKWMFLTNNIVNINIYPAELKLFKNVDQPSVSFALRRNENQKFLNVSGYQDSLSPTSHCLLDVQNLLLSTDYTLPISIAGNHEQLKILSTLSVFPKLSELENTGNLWMGRELDETNYKEWLSLKGRHPFVKGRDIDRFDRVTTPKVFVNEELKSSMPDSVQYHRIIWRDVSRPNQKRRVIATLIPPGYVTGNSLGVLHVREQKNQKNLLALLGLISSFVFEFQLRAYLATAHVSAGVMKKVSIPEWNSTLVENIASLIEKRLDGILSAEHEIEIAVARAYGLNRNQFDEILGAFPKITEQEKNVLLNPILWN